MVVLIMLTIMISPTTVMVEKAATQNVLNPTAVLMEGLAVLLIRITLAIQLMVTEVGAARQITNFLQGEVSSAAANGGNGGLDNSFNSGVSGSGNGGSGGFATGQPRGFPIPGLGVPSEIATANGGNGGEAYYLDSSANGGNGGNNNSGPDCGNGGNGGKATFGGSANGGNGGNGFCGANGGNGSEALDDGVADGQNGTDANGGFAIGVGSEADAANGHNGGAANLSAKYTIDSVLRWVRRWAIFWVLRILRGGIWVSNDECSGME
jgi:hypothetical protein